MPICQIFKEKFMFFYKWARVAKKTYFPVGENLGNDIIKLC